MSVAVRVIPCLDVDAGRVVKGVRFENLRDAGDPVELARRYGAEGADEVTFLDVSASTEGRATTLDVVSRTAEEIFVWSVDQVPYFALPRYVEIREELPRTPLGKIQKRELREQGVTADTWDFEKSGISVERR